MPKLTVAVLYGGKSSEHDVSVHSAQAVCQTLEQKYNLIKIFISKEGLWYLQEFCGPKTQSDVEVSPVISQEYHLYSKDGQRLKADIFFPVLHGTMGEDGTMQGLFEIMNVPYVGCDVLTSAMGMDKEICKLLASFYQVPIVPYIKLDADVEYKDAELFEAVSKLGYPLFVKPLALGSSIGVTKVDEEKDLKSAIAKAFKYDRAVLIEMAVNNVREIFCGVIGAGQDIHTSLCGELTAINSKFFDYHAKYEDPHGCDIKALADLPQKMQDDMRKNSATIFKVLRGCGLARVDFLLGSDGKYYFSEINTMPGMSTTSLFPQLWQASSKSYPDVLDILIHLGLNRKQSSKKLSLER